MHRFYYHQHLCDNTNATSRLQNQILFLVLRGNVLREEIANGTELGILAEKYISKGHLVPDGVVICMLAEVLDNKGKSNGVIFDGFPRTLAQGEALDKLLKDRNEEISVVVNLDVPEEELIERMLKRGLQSGRSDDNIETIKSRLEVYKSQTSPLKEYYEATGKLVQIKGKGSIDEIFAQIAQAVDESTK